MVDHTHDPSRTAPMIHGGPHPRSIDKKTQKHSRHVDPQKFFVFLLVLEHVQSLNVGRRHLVSSGIGAPLRRAAHGEGTTQTEGTSEARLVPQPEPF